MIFPEEGDHSPTSPKVSKKLKKETIARLNDLLRQHGTGGQMVMTQGIAHIQQNNLAQFMDIMMAIQRFEKFDKDCDPYGEHDFGVVIVDGTKVFWKIDYYASDMESLSPDPADPNVTNRVMTIMLAEEY